MCSPSGRLVGGPEDLIAALKETFRSPDPELHIPAVLSSLVFCPSRWAKFLHFSPDRYVRSLVATDADFSILLLCWNPGQATPVHSHSEHSGPMRVHSFVRVLSGRLTLAQFQDETGAAQLSSRLLDSRDADVLVENDDTLLGYHQLANVAADGDSSQPAVSVHVYTPPYTSCPYARSGSCSPRQVPCVYHPQPQWESESGLASTVLVNPSYGSLSDLIALLRQEIQFESDGRTHPKCNIEHVKTIMRNFQLNPQEWLPYRTRSKHKYTRNIIAYEKKFTMILLVWDKHQYSPIHDHASSNCFVKVLSGVLQEIRYSAVGYDLAPITAADDDPGLITRSANIYSPGAVTYINDSLGLHKMGNPSRSAVACSLHVYSPPYRQCNIFKILPPLKTKTAVATTKTTADNNNNNNNNNIASDDAGDQPPLHYEKEMVRMTSIYGDNRQFMEHDASTSPPTPTLSPSSPIRSVVSHNLPALSALLRKVFALPADAERTKTIQAILEGVAFSKDEWREYVHFCPQRYSRNLLVLDEQFSLILNCWSPLQGTPVHDHGSCDRQSWVRVLDGQLSLTEFDESGAQLSQQRYSDADFFPDNLTSLHKLENLSATDSAVSLHLYSPPLVHCTYIDERGAKKQMPASFCSPDLAPVPSLSFDDSCPSASSSSSSSSSSSVSASKSCARDLSALSMALRTQDAVYSNLRCFSYLLAKILFDAIKGKESVPNCLLIEATRHSADLLAVMRSVRFHRDEWHQYDSQSTGATTAYFPIASCDVYSLYLFRWPHKGSYLFDRKQSAAWVRILAGELEEIQYEDIDLGNGAQTVEAQSNSLQTDSVFFRTSHIVNRLTNTKKTCAYSLHVFTPPVTLGSCPSQFQSSLDEI